MAECWQIEVKGYEEKHKNKVMAAGECEIMMPVAVHSKSGYEGAEGPFLKRRETSGMHLKVCSIQKVETKNCG